MPRFSNPFDPRRYRSHRASFGARPVTEEAAPCKPHQSHNPAPQSRDKPHLSVGTIPDKLDELRDYVRSVSTHVKYLQGLTEEERSSITEVIEIKRKLKTVHRNLEVFLAERGSGLGEEVEKLVCDATKHTWRSYRGVVKLEERLKRLNHGKKKALEIEHIISEPRIVRSTRTDGDRKEVDIPSSPARRKRPCTNVDQQNTERESNKEFQMSGALPFEDGPTPAIPATLANALDILRNLPRVLTHGASSRVTNSTDQLETNPEKIPQPRHEVKRRVQYEEANMGPWLHEPDRVRRGSCNGFMVTEMTLKGLEDADYVLPYLHYMKLHEVRCLKDWLADKGHVTSSGAISRMEKVLSCIQLLQTGCRYETLAVIYSRSPRQVKEACIEVMQGLLRLHQETVREGEMGEQAMYIPLWGIWKKYVVTDGKAEVYFGFGWTQVAKVLVALNLYMGRWRKQGKFAVDGPAFTWGKFFMSQGIGSSVPSLVDDDDDDGQTCEVEV